MSKNENKNQGKSKSDEKSNNSLEITDPVQIEILKKTGAENKALAFSLILKACTASFGTGINDSKNVESTAAAFDEVKPRDAVDGMLTTHMVICHNQAMKYLEDAIEAYDLSIKEKNINISTKLLRAFRATADALEKRRATVQKLKIERINFNDGAQTIVGNINQQEAKKHITE